MIARLLTVLCLLWPAAPAHAQDSNSDAARLAAAQAAFDRGEWEEAAKLAQGSPQQSPDLDFLAGLSYARRARWKEANSSFEAGRRKSPNDPRFLVELAGVAYQQKNFLDAKRDLLAALRPTPAIPMPASSSEPSTFLKAISRRP